MGLKWVVGDKYHIRADGEEGRYHIAKTVHGRAVKYSAFGPMLWSSAHDKANIVNLLQAPIGTVTEAKIICEKHNEQACAKAQAGEVGA